MNPLALLIKLFALTFFANRTCIANTIMYCEEAEVKCPFRDSEYTCESTLQEREIKAVGNWFKGKISDYQKMNE